MVMELIRATSPLEGRFFYCGYSPVPGDAGQPRTLNLRLEPFVILSLWQ